jgi:hypothetical protein
VIMCRKVKMEIVDVKFNTNVQIIYSHYFSLVDLSLTISASTASINTLPAAAVVATTTISEAFILRIQ